MILTLVLTGLVGTALAGVALYYWPQIMSWAREHVLPWIDRNIPELADSVRLAFQDLDNVAVGLRRTVRAAWHKLRKVLLSQVAEFVQVYDSNWAVRITSYLRNLEERDKPYVKVVTEQGLRWEELPEDVRAAAMSNGINGTKVDIVKARDQLLSEMA
jgi:hypothetical protein